MPDTTTPQPAKEISSRQRSGIASTPSTSASPSTTKKRRSTPRKTARVPSKPVLAKDPFKTVRDFREGINKTIEKLYPEGNTVAADVLREVRKLLDLRLPEAVAEYEKQEQEQALAQLERQVRDEALRKARS
jgi:hypothetical protein